MALHPRSITGFLTLEAQRGRIRRRHVLPIAVEERRRLLRLDQGRGRTASNGLQHNIN